MIAIDTNVLLRYLMNDDRVHTSKTVSLFKAHYPILITDVVLTELVWTLKGKRYGLNRLEVADVIRALVGDGHFQFENSQIIWQALVDYVDSKSVKSKKLDFPDALIVHKAALCAIEKGYEFKGVYSFDKAIHQLPNTHQP